MAEVYTPSTGAIGYSRQPLDPARCKAGVHGRERWSHYAQCTRKVWADGWCKTHHPDAVDARDRAAAAKYEASCRTRAMGSYGERFLAALAKIRDGDNDPRETARLALEGCKYEPRPVSPPQLSEDGL